MKQTSIYLSLVLWILNCFSNPTLEAAYTIQNGRIVNAESIATLPADQHYELGMNALNVCDWYEAQRQFLIVTTNFSGTQYGQEGYYYLGIAEYNLCEYDFANESFSQYLKCQNNPQHFLSAIQYKYFIAEKLRCGAKRRFLGTKQLPKWATGRTMALKIYDEVIAAMPSNEIAAQALYSKGNLLWNLGEYRESIDSFQLICKRFPKLSLAPESYVIISYIYIDLCKSEPQNPDVLAFAELNARRFKMSFPQEERVSEVESNVQFIKELYAKALFDTGCFYERVCQPRAAIIYYYSAIRQFPDTQIARDCVEKLYILDPTFCEEDLLRIRSSNSSDLKSETDTEEEDSKVDEPKEEEI